MEQVYISNLGKKITLPQLWWLFITQVVEGFISGVSDQIFPLSVIVAPDIYFQQA